MIPYAYRGTKEQSEGELRPSIFDEGNRAVWDQVRRLLIWLLKQLDKWYGWRTFDGK
jgi:hypothetical protein